MAMILLGSNQIKAQSQGALLEEAEAWHMLNPDSAIYYCNQFLEFYDSKIPDSLLTKAFFLKGWNLFLKHEYLEAVQAFKALENHAEVDNVLFIRAKGRSGVAYKELGLFDSAFIYLQQYDTLVDKYLGTNAIEAKLELGELYRAMNRTEESNQLKLEAIRRARKAKDRKDLTMALFYYLDDIIYEEKAARKFLKSAALEPLRLLAEKLGSSADYTEKSLEKVFLAVMEQTGLKLGKIAQPVRGALTGKTASPGIFEIMAILGAERVIPRLERAIRFVEDRTAELS